MISQGKSTGNSRVKIFLIFPVSIVVFIFYSFTNTPVSRLQKDPALSMITDTSQLRDTANKYYMVDKMPQFRRGNINKFRIWVGKHVKYPKGAAVQGIQGKVYVSFTIETNGKVDHVKVVKSTHPLLDAEAVRVVRSSPKWKPGIKKGEKVRVAFTIPIIFVIQDEY